MADTKNSRNRGRNDERQGGSALALVVPAPNLPPIVAVLCCKLAPRWQIRTEHGAISARMLGFLAPEILDITFGAGF
jgi:hypothetical protein